MNPIRVAHEGDIAVVTMDDGKANAMGMAFVEALGDALDAVERSDARAVALLGRERFFSAGIDLRGWKQMSRDDKVRYSTVLVRTLVQAYAFPRPIVAGVTGHALAGGGLLALAADVRIAADHDARFGPYEVAAGIAMPPFGVAIGESALAPAEQIALVLHGEVWSPQYAHERGVMQELVAPDALGQRVRERARALSALPSAAYAATKAEMRASRAREVTERFERQIDDFIPQVDAVAEAYGA